MEGSRKARGVLERIGGYSKVIERIGGYWKGEGCIMEGMEGFGGTTGGYQEAEGVWKILNHDRLLLIQVLFY